MPTYEVVVKETHKWHWVGKYIQIIAAQRRIGSYIYYLCVLAYSAELLQNISLSLNSIS